MSAEWQHASLVSNIGKWAWIIGLLNGVLSIIFGFVGIGTYLYWSSFLPGYYIPTYDIWLIIGGIILIFFSLTQKV